MATKKVGSTGRFGAKYGRKIKIRVRDIESVSKTRHNCPKCKMLALKRVATGVWGCSACGAKLAGGAYSPAQKSERAVEKPIGVEEYEEEQTAKKDAKKTKTPKKEEQ
ncbi:MAG: 50S ribosomal protein L37ae [archaeon]